MLAFFYQFRQKLGELGRSTTCNCQACTHIETLQLKVIVHSGEALFHRVLNFVELAGVDVIIVHRLLKNSVKAGQYLLLTEAARADLIFSEAISLVESAETYADIGRVNTLVYLPGGEATKPQQPERDGFGQRFGQSWWLYTKLWFAPLTRRAGPFQNVETGTGILGRIAFGVLTVVLTPLFLPVGVIFVSLHALKTPSPVSPAAPGHVHKADGTCCRKS